MQHVQFHQRHCVERAQQRRNGNEVARRIDHQAAPGETRRIGDQHARQRLDATPLSCASVASPRRTPHSVAAVSSACDASIFSEYDSSSSRSGYGADAAAQSIASVAPPPPRRRHALRQPRRPLVRAATCARRAIPPSTPARSVRARVSVRVTRRGHGINASASLIAFERLSDRVATESQRLSATHTGLVNAMVA